MAASKPRIRNVITARAWSDVRNGWLGHVPTFGSLGAKPDPGLERLPPLQEISFTEIRTRIPDIEGVRASMLWEAVFLFHKCAHCHLAAQRLGTMGMQSWGMFNAYHAAYLGARGVMALLGIALPFLPTSGQLLIDAYPVPEATKDIKKHAAGLWKFEELLIVKSTLFDHRDVWEALQRTLEVADVKVWNSRLRDELTDLNHELIAKSRNGFLYRAAFWPSDDLLSDATAEQWLGLLGTGLDTATEGFLLRLSCNVYLLFEQLMADLAERSGPIRDQLEGARVVSDPSDDDLQFYRNFIAQVGAVA